MKVNWLDRCVAPVGPYMVLVQSEDAYRAAVKHLKVDYPDPMINEHAHATTHHLNNQKGELTCIVALGSTEGRTGTEIAGLLVHEAVHIWQQHCQRIGEKFPASEQEAYGIQWIAQTLMNEYARQMKERMK